MARRLDTFISPIKFKSCIRLWLNNMHRDFLVLVIDKAAGNSTFVYKIFYASVIAKELWLYINPSIYIYIKINSLSANHINKILEIWKFNLVLTIFLLKIINCLVSTRCLHKNPIKARFIKASPKSFMKLLARTITLILRLLFWQIHAYNNKGRFSWALTLRVIQNNKAVTDAIINFLNLEKST